MRTTQVFLLAVVLSTSAHAAPPLPESGQSRLDTARLTCGRATLTSKTHWLLLPDSPSVWLEQSIQLAGEHGTKALPTEGRPGQRVTAGHSGLSAVVSSWACIQSKRGTNYIFLGYACGSDDAEKFCGGEREWFRILDEQGARLDAGFARQDRRYDALHARLGVAELMAQGVPMSSLIPDD